MMWLSIPLMFLGCTKQVPTEASVKRDRRMEGRYIVADPGPGWSKVRAGGADKAWFHKESSASIYFDSNCQDRYEDGKLSALLTHLTFGIARGESLREEAMVLDGREALLRVQPGLLDGVPVRVGAVVTKKDDCLYDGLLIAPPSTFDSQWSTFAKVIAGFKTRGR